VSFNITTRQVWENHEVQHRYFENREVQHRYIENREVQFATIIVRKKRELNFTTMRNVKFNNTTMRAGENPTSCCILLQRNVKSGVELFEVLSEWNAHCHI
jgi:hypothetical protein